MEYLVIFLFVWAAAATVLVLRGRAKLKNVMKEQQQCREKNRELYRVLAESWLGDEECHATVMHVVNRLSAEEYDDFIRQLESGFQD